MSNQDSFVDKVKKTVSDASENIIRVLGTTLLSGGGVTFSQTAPNPGISGLGLSTVNKDIIIVPNISGAGDSTYSYSQIDFKFKANSNSYNNLDGTETKASIYNYGERPLGSAFDTPVLVMGGSWGNTTWAPSDKWNKGNSPSAGKGFIDFENGYGNLIFFKPASSAFYASLLNDIGMYGIGNSIVFKSFASPIPGIASTSATQVSFIGSGSTNTLNIHGSSTNNSTVNVAFRSSFSVANSTIGDTLALGLSSAASGTAGTIFFPGANTPKYVLATLSSSLTSGALYYGSGNGNTLTQLAVGSQNTVLRVSSSNVPEWSTLTGQSLNISNNPSGTYYPILNDSNSAGGNLAVDPQFLIDTTNNIVEISARLRAGTSVSAPLYTSANGITIQSGLARTDAIRILAGVAGAGGTFVSFDTFNKRVGIGISTPVYSLDIFGGDVNVGSGNSYRIDGTVVLSSDTLGSNIFFSNLKKVGIVTDGTWSGSTITAYYGGTGLQGPGVAGNILYSDSESTWASVDPLTVIVGAATTATNVDVNLTSSSDTHYFAFTNDSDGGSGVALSIASGISVVPSTSTVTATTFSGSLSGTATTATNVNSVASGSTNFAHELMFTRFSAGSGVGLSQNSNLTYNPATNILNINSGVLTGIAVTVDSLTGTIRTATQDSITSASALATVGTITTGRWQSSTAIAVTYGGTGADLSGLARTNEIPVLGGLGQAMSSIDNGTDGHILVSRGQTQTPNFTNSSSASFTFSNGLNVTGGLTIDNGTRTGEITQPNDIATKSYVDSLSSGILPKGIAKYSTTAGIAGSYRKASAIANSNSDIGGFIIATSNTSLSDGEPGFDGLLVAPIIGDRVLVRFGVTGGFGSASDPYVPFSTITTQGSFGSSYIANGIYRITDLGSISSPWILTRDTSVDTNSELRNGTYIYVDEGTTYADYSFICDLSAAPSFGSTQITFTEFARATDVTAGQGLFKTGSTIGLDVKLVTDDISGVRDRTFRFGGERESSGFGSSVWPIFQVSTASGTESDIRLQSEATGISLVGGVTEKTFTLGDNLTISGNQGLTLDASSNKISLGLGDLGTGQFDFVINNNLTTDLAMSVTSGPNLTFSYDSAASGFTFTDTYSSSTGFQLNAIKNVSSISAKGKFNFENANSTDTHTLRFVKDATQYVLSTTDTSFTAGDLFYVTGTGFTNLSRLALGTGTGSSVLIRSGAAPVWGTVNLSSTDFVSGTLPLARGGTGADLSSATLNQVVVVGSSALAAAGTGLTFANGRLTASTSIFIGANQVPVATNITSARLVYAQSATELRSQNSVIINATASNLGVGATYLSVAFGASSNNNSTLLDVRATSAVGTGFTGWLFRVSKTTNERFSILHNGTTTISPISGATGLVVSGTANTAAVVTGGRTILAAGDASYASLNIASGTNPGSGNIFTGDLWFNGTNLYFRKDATTNVDLLNTGTVQGSGTAPKIARWSANTTLTDSSISDSGVGVTILTSAVSTGTGSTAYLTIQSVSADEADPNKYNSYFLRGIDSTNNRIFSVDISGHLRATTKSFDIPHPTKPGKRLVYGVLEGPEHGVYHRGTISGFGNIDVLLPEYWSKLAGDNYTIQITPWGNYNIKIVNKTDSYFTVNLVGMNLFNKNKHYKFDYIVHGSRKDAPLDIEQ